jgi:hypothetical protein
VSRKIGALELQEAVYRTLRQRMPAVAVYDSVPDSGAFPYVVIGDDTILDDSTKTGAGVEASVTVQIFSRALGFSEAKGIAEQVAGAITAGALAVSGFLVTFQALEGSESFRDGEDRRVVVRFKLKLQEL